VNEQGYRDFVLIREEFRDLVFRMGKRAPWLGELQDRLRIACGYDDYRVETPVVFNGELDLTDRNAEPRFILVADNPGKKEQLSVNRRYLVGQSGKLATGWFSRELGMDFRRQVIILNKTPIHTPKTAELRSLLAIAGERRTELSDLLEESQRKMAGFAFRLQSSLCCPIWISGYGELGARGLFRAYSDELTKLFSPAPGWQRENLWLFRHFSMNQFAIEMKKKTPMRNSAEDGQIGSDQEIMGCDSRSSRMLMNLRAIGSENRVRILGF